MTTIAPRPVRSSQKRSRLVTAVSIALVIAGLTIGLLVAFSSGGSAGPSIQPAPAGPSNASTESPSTERLCRANPAQPC